MNDKMNYDEMKKVQLSSAYGKTVKSYALDGKTIAAIDRISSDLGIKSRSETIREIIKRYAEWQDNQNRQS